MASGKTEKAGQGCRGLSDVSRALSARENETSAAESLTIAPFAAGTPPPPDAVFDEAQFREYVGNDTAVLLKVVHCFLDDTPGRMTAIRAALSTGDAPKVARIAHSLKGSVSFLAAGAALEAAREVETIAGTGDLRGVADAGAALGGEIVRLTAALEAFVARTPSRAQP